MFVGAIAVIVAVMGLAYLVWLSGDEVSTPSAPRLQAKPAPVFPRFTEVKGLVETKGPTGGWHKAVVGDTLSPGVDVRASADAATHLAYGNNVKMHLLGGTQVQLAPSGSGALRFVVGEGLLFADVLPGAGRVQFVNQRGDAVAETQDGALYVGAEPDGALRAAVTRGEATLEAQGKRVLLKAGYVSVAKAGKAPDDPQQVPGTLLLKVRWPLAATAKKNHLIEGKTQPGTRIRMGDGWLWVDEAGGFKVPVQLAEGTQELTVHAVDAMGRTTQEKSPPIELDTQAVAPAVQTSPAMWRKDHSKGTTK